MGGLLTAALRYLLGMLIMMLEPGAYRLPDAAYLLPLTIGGFFLGGFFAFRVLEAEPTAREVRTANEAPKVGVGEPLVS